MVENLYETVTEPIPEEVYRIFKSSFGNEVWKKRVELELRSYPNEPISLGDQWKHLESMDSPKPLMKTKFEWEFTNTLREIKTNEAGRRVAVVESRAEWKTDEPQKIWPWEQDSFQVEVNSDVVKKYDIEASVELFREERTQVIVKTRFQYDNGPYTVALVVKQTTKTSCERIEE